MDQPAPTAPPVVAVVVTHDPGPWFDEVLDRLAAQDYPNLRILVLDAGSSTDPTDRVGERLPGAYVRRMAANPGFGAVANQVQRLVEGATFYCFLHDDVALDPGTIRLLVEETYRSNAGIVGPKLVSWDDDRRLESVGFGVDKFAVASSPVEPGELDQEQHDAVRDTFFVPTPCLLVRADLFVALGGFDKDMPFHGDDLDLCWRAHIAGARVLVVPSARARHRSQLAERRDRDDEANLAARHRVRTVFSNYSAPHLLRVLPQLAVLNLLELMLALVTAKPRQARAVIGGWTWNLGRLGQISRKRKQVRALRRVPDREIRRLQERGSARLATFVRGAAGRGEGLSAVTGAGRTLMANVRSGARNASFLAWAIVLGIFLIGSRSLITGRVAAYGDLVPFGGSAGDLLRGYLSGWHTGGLGDAAPAPTGEALVGLAGLLTGGALAGLRTLLVLGPLVAGFIGMWRLTRPLESQAGRITGLIVYAAAPLGYDALANGRWAGLALYGATPWILARLARLSGLAPYGPNEGESGPGIPRRSLLGQVVGLGLILAVVATVAPGVLVLTLVMALALVAASLLTGSGTTSLPALAGAVGAVVVAFVLHVPWSFSAFLSSDGRESVSPAPLAGAADRGLAALLRLDVGPVGSALGLALVGTALLALAAGREWRFTWAARAVTIALASLGLAWAVDRDWLGDAPLLPPVEAMLAPVAAAVAWAAALGAVTFVRDIKGTRLSWRHPLAFLSLVAALVGVVPVLLASSGGRWRMPDSDLALYVPADPSGGDYRVLWLGDPRALPLPGWTITDGLAYGFSENGAPDLDDYWPGAPTRADELVTDALALAAEGQTSRLGTLVAPMSVRYVVVPNKGAPAAESVPSYPPPQNLLDTLAAQLDLRRIDVNDALVMYENVSWIPARAVLSPAAAQASTGAGFESLLGVDLSGSAPVLPEADGANRFTGEVPSGRVYLSDQADGRWELRVGGVIVERQPAFGFANAFDVATGGPATLRYKTPLNRPISVAVQALLWLLALRFVVVAAYRGGEVPVGRRRRAVATAPAVPAVLPTVSAPTVIRIDEPVAAIEERPWTERPDEPLPVPAALEDELPDGVVPPEAATLSETEAELEAEDADVVADDAAGSVDEGDDPAHVIADGAPARSLVWHDVVQAEPHDPAEVLAGSRALQAALGDHEPILPWASDDEHTDDEGHQ